MNLIDSASLVVTPNGYKASKLYSIVPTDGTGDMTFARTGNTATRVNSSGLIETVNANIPRLDYLGSTCPKLLLEPQRTNLILRSEEFDNASWVKESGGIASAPVVTSNSAISPDGTMDAELIVFNLNGGTVSGDISQLSQAVTGTTSTVYTYTIYAKTSDNSTKVMNLVNGNGIPTLITITGSWQRFSITYTASTTTNNIRLRLRGSEGTSTSASINLWGAQLEAGAYATSYIPTTTASVTRNADSCSKTGISSLIGQTEGTFFVDFNVINANGSIFYQLSNTIGAGSYINSIYMFQNATSYFDIVSSLTAGIQASFRLSSLNVGRHKVAIGYKANDFVAYVDGILVGTDTSGTLGTYNVLDIYAFDIATQLDYINSAALWKTRLSNAELATLTTI
jgi:hypothetical protein